ncbi:hypothetical protein PVAP13_5KG040001 [Panicum virgatum]|uniref:Uncharacterized protein n=1 Tax=Panicum virgatum TaxID=38727 RepID=A0A8T0S8T3_PANVG|nr:hypothetical protein PVAP13_5KG040001 [Panicum virgatum]
MFDPWRLLLLLMVLAVVAGDVRYDSPSVRYVYLNSMCSGWWCCIPFWGFASSALVDFGLKTAELFFFFTGVDVADGLSSSSGASIRASAYCLLRHFHGLGPPHRLGRSLLSLFSALSTSGLQGGGGRSELRETRRRRRTGDSSWGPGCNFLYLRRSLCKLGCSKKKLSLLLLLLFGAEPPTVFIFLFVLLCRRGPV